MNIQYPTGFFGQIVSRSGLASKHQLFIPMGTIDRDYTGPIYVIMQNNGSSTFRVTKGMCVAQLIMQPHCTPNLLLNPQPPETMERGEHGFGSPGIYTMQRNMHCLPPPTHDEYRETKNTNEMEKNNSSNRLNPHLQLIHPPQDSQKEEKSKEQQTKTLAATDCFDTQQLLPNTLAVQTHEKETTTGKDPKTTTKSQPDITQPQIIDTQPLTMPRDQNTPVVEDVKDGDENDGWEE
eukprot:12948202-Ditylum_brightwellii.AAC.1